MTHPTPQPRILSVQEAATLLAQAPAWLQGPILMSLYAGLRPTEIVGLQWTDLDLEQAQVCVSSARSTQSRLIPLSGPLVPLIQQLRKHAAVSPTVFLTGQDHPLTTRTLTVALHQASQHAQLPGLRFNCLRKTCAVWAVEAKLPLVLVARMLGTHLHAISTRLALDRRSTKPPIVNPDQVHGSNKFRALTARLWANPSAYDPGLIARCIPATSTAEAAD